MMTAVRRAIYVYAYWLPLKEPLLMGKLYSELLRGKEVFAFEYHLQWLKSGYAKATVR